MVGDHDFIGGVEVDLEDDILQGRRTEDPTTSEWYQITLDGADRGQVQIEFRWNDKVGHRSRRTLSWSVVQTLQTLTSERHRSACWAFS